MWLNPYAGGEKSLRNHGQMNGNRVMVRLKEIHKVKLLRPGTINVL